MSNPQDRIPVDLYRHFQRSLPGVDSLYHLMRAAVDSSAQPGDTVLIVGAGGGREIEALAASPLALRMVGVDPSGAMLELARHYADLQGASDRTQLIEATVDAVPATLRAGFATSILVMHFLPDDGAKTAYLDAIRSRVRPGARLFLADISPSDASEFKLMQPLFLAHARLMGLDPARMAEGVEMIGSLPVVPPERIQQLLADAGFGVAMPVFQGLWYRAWIANAS